MFPAISSHVEDFVLWQYSKHNEDYVKGILFEMNWRGNFALADLLHTILSRVKSGGSSVEYYLAVHMACLIYKQIDMSIPSRLPEIDKFCLNAVMEVVYSESKKTTQGYFDEFQSAGLMPFNTCNFFQTDPKDGSSLDRRIVRPSIMMLEAFKWQVALDTHEVSIPQ